MFEKLKNNERDDIDDEQRLHVIGYEKFSGIKLDDGEENMLNNYTNDGTIKGSLLYTASKILRKDQLSILEECAVELCLSSIINFVNPSVYSLILAEIDDSIVSKFRANATTIKGMEDDTNELFDNIIKHSQDTDDMLSFIQSTKSKLSKERKRGSEAYIMLSIVEHVVGNFNLWHVNGHESEITYYRRFAGLLDFLFEKQENKRLGSKAGASEVKAHPFFKSLRFALLRHMTPPIVPGITAQNSSMYRSAGGKESGSLDLDAYKNVIVSSQNPFAKFNSVTLYHDGDSDSETIVLTDDDNSDDEKF